MIGTAVQAGGRPRVIAHRGASAVAPPNSLAALEAAVAAGADAVEIDIGEGLLLGHDAADRRPGAPTLEAALELLAPTGLDVQVDLKHAAIEAAVAATLREHAFVGRSLVSSTSTAALRRLREADPDIPRARGYPHDRAGVSRVPWPAALIRASAGLARSATPLRLAGLAHGVQVVALHHALVSERAVAAAHDRGVAVIAWTVNAEADIARVVRAGVDAVTTDDPGKAQQFMRTL